MKAIVAMVTGIVMQVLALVVFDASSTEGFFAYLMGALIGTQLIEKEAE